MRKSAWLALAFAFGMAHGQGLPMQVEEPAELAAPPIDPESEADAWQAKAVKSGSAALSKEERAAYQERRKMVEEMASEIRMKREALLHSAEEDRAARVQELQKLILEPAVHGKLDKKIKEQLEKNFEKQTQAQQKQLEKLEKKIEKTLEEKSLEEKQEKLDKGKAGRPEKIKTGKSGK